MQKIDVFVTPQLTADLYCFEPGQAQRSHKHTVSDKVYFVLEGTGRFSVGRTTREYKAGSAVLAPANEEHGVVNMAEERLVLLAVTAPPPPKV
jgi:quercetin dioxygenase-like cupin family protein